MTWIDQEADDEHEKYWVNIRGKIGYLRKSLIDKVPESSLAQLFTGKIKCQMVEGIPFLDKDPETFKNVVIYLANGLNLPKLDKVKMKKLTKELEYWRIQFYILTMEEQLENVMTSVPENCDKKAVKEWKKHGILNLEKYFDIDDNLTFAVKLDQYKQSTNETTNYYG